jgi:hypothetical protein
VANVRDNALVYRRILEALEVDRKLFLAIGGHLFSQDILGAVLQTHQSWMADSMTMSCGSSFRLKVWGVQL